jgi:hypothetical protein
MSRMESIWDSQACRVTCRRKRWTLSPLLQRCADAPDGRASATEVTESTVHTEVGIVFLEAASRRSTLQLGLKGVLSGVPPQALDALAIAAEVSRSPFLCRWGGSAVLQHTCTTPEPLASMTARLACRGCVSRAWQGYRPTDHSAQTPLLPPPRSCARGVCPRVCDHLPPLHARATRARR